MMSQLICLGEAIYELNQQSDGSYKSGLGGDVSNVAVSASRSGVNSALVSALGEDSYAAEFRALWAKENISDAYVLKAKQHFTGKYYVTHDANGHHFKYQRKGSAASHFSKVDLPLKLIANSEVCYASGISLAISKTMSDSVFALFELARKHGKLCAFDPNFRPALWNADAASQLTHQLMVGCDIALPGLDDARQLTGLDNALEIVEFYHDLGASIVALTMGANGVLVSDGSSVQKIAAVSVLAVDATGAGDCFNGAFIAEYLATKDVFKAARYANIAAALSTTDYGALTAVATRQTIQKTIANI
jgi:2-dehydro-3-deoxygluconokinase